MVGKGSSNGMPAMLLLVVGRQSQSLEEFSTTAGSDAKILELLTDAEALMQTFQSLGAGSWSFSVRSIDGAGNVETITAPFHSWTIALSSGYPIISGGDSGITAKYVS